MPVPPAHYSYPLSTDVINTFFEKVDFGKAMSLIYEGKPIYVFDPEDNNLVLLTKPFKDSFSIHFPGKPVGAYPVSTISYARDLSKYLLSTFYCPATFFALDNLRAYSGSYSSFMLLEDAWCEVGFQESSELVMVREVSSSTPDGKLLDIHYDHPNSFDGYALSYSISDFFELLREGCHIIPKPSLLSPY